MQGLRSKEKHMVTGTSFISLPIRQREVVDALRPVR